MFYQMKQSILAFKSENSGDLDAFGIDTWGVDYGILDKNGVLLSNPRCYRRYRQRGCGSCPCSYSPEDPVRQDGDRLHEL